MAENSRTITVRFDEEQMAQIKALVAAVRKSQAELNARLDRLGDRLSDAAARGAKRGRTR